MTLKEYFERLRSKTLLELDSLIRGNKHDQEIEQIDDYLLALHKPGIFSGRDSAEIKYDKQFQSACLYLTKELGLDVDKATVFQFYNSFEYLKKLKKFKNG